MSTKKKYKDGWKLECVPNDVPLLYKNERQPLIYYIKCKTTGQGYIGSTRDVCERIKNHFGSLSKNEHHNYKLQLAFNCYGLEAFEWGIIEKCPLSELASREEYWIKRCPKERLFNIVVENIKRDQKKIPISEKEAEAYLTLQSQRKPESKVFDVDWFLVYDERLKDTFGYWFGTYVRGQRAFIAGYKKPKMEAIDKAIEGWVDAHGYLGTFNYKKTREMFRSLFGQQYYPTYDNVYKIVKDKLKTGIKEYNIVTFVSDFKKWSPPL